jgi:hypothetical protein
LPPGTIQRRHRQAPPAQLLLNFERHHDRIVSRKPWGKQGFQMGKWP